MGRVRDPGLSSSFVGLMSITSRPSHYNLRSLGEAPGILEPVLIPEPVQVVNNLDNQEFEPMLIKNMTGVFRWENTEGEGFQNVVLCKKI